MEVFDPVIGTLSLKYVWRRDYEIQFCGEVLTVDLNIEANEKEPITAEQRDAFLEFDKNKSRLLWEAVCAVFTFYQDHRYEFIEYIEEGDISNLAPDISGPSDMIKLLSLQVVRVLDCTLDERRVALFFGARFERELGISVLIVNETVDLVTTDVLY